MLKELGRQLAAIRDELKVSRVEVAAKADMDRATVAALEDGSGTLASLAVVTAALGYCIGPEPSALANKRQWLGIGGRSLAKAADVSRPTLLAMETTGRGRVATFEAVCRALGEAPVLRASEQTWWTPPELVRHVLDALATPRFDLDPASPDVPTVPCDHFYTVKDGGLWLPWRGVTFVNPPYDHVPRWLAKAVEEFRAGRATIVIGLVPYRPETNAWKLLVRSEATVFVLEDRLRFGGRSYISPSVSAVIVWGGTDQLRTALGHSLPPHHRLARAATPNDGLAARASLQSVTGFS